MPSKIILSGGKTTIVDDEMRWLSEYRWYFHNGYARHGGYKNKTHFHAFLHHAVAGYPLGGIRIDHINGNPLDNRRENLRFVTHRMNQHNTKMQRGEKKKTSAFIGVCWHKQRRKWVAAIQIDRKVQHLGCFDIEEDASRAYQEALAQCVLPTQ